MFTVSDMMTPHPHTLSPSHTLADAKKMMAEQGIRHIPITNDENQLVGLVTQRDVLAAQESSLEHFSKANAISTLDVSLDQCMNRTLLSVNSHAGLKEAATYMQKHKIGCLPVTHQKKLVGIITDSDFVSIAINLLEIQEEIEPLNEDEA
ncbi:CBS domain-containing protein [Photobacterium sp.]|uniref:CBS domain-containing protein n=1 Tax=Photobacterium sp. TaxID=660 RepID=UPI00299D6066|nr:CBS domain-containing protein [Photobacterium sp.]MDX1302504.1 CBS domain-containing protein [Photobacterium sp.]